ncbi:diaminopimelate decarboxylase [uncultured Alistipes sp.]|mgnify:FL=1|uniref:diaminopimelate decarboxylase n=1 Tax=uncultured Alistipes sp. TaxID=538949 RepID=UPI0026360C80|nr:diaminopimelate decarboxylase [uncultured Alistipes sp.]
MLSRHIASKLRGLETPFYLYDTALLRQTLESVVSEAGKFGYKVHYAIKANYDDHLLAIIREYGLGIDCASGNELRKAVESGFAPEGIVYAGVGKRDKELRYAIEQGIMAINCESIEELEVVNALAAEAGRTTDVALRINPDIDPRTNHCIDTGQADSKFGISYEEVLEHAGRIKALDHLNIVGVHLHIGSQIRELHVFENMCRKVNVIVANLEQLGFTFRFVDVGGGLGVNYDVPENEPIPNFASLFSIVHNHLDVGDKEVHFEFGRSIVAECGELITRVLFNKTTATGRKLVIVDASMTELIRPALYGSYHNIENITSEEEAFDKYTVVGTACESTDVFDENVGLRKTRRGDLLSIKSAGAYGMSMASRYNLHDLPGAVYSDEL